LPEVVAIPDVSRADGLVLPADIAAPLSRSWTEADAFAFCTALTKAHYENFPVGSILAPKDVQPAIHSLYAFMRTADDFSDENRQPGDEPARAAYLASWNQLLTECEQGHPRHPIFIALAVTIKRYQLPVQWLRDLLHAFTLDVTVNRYATYEQLLEYCRYSANPVGRLILTLFGYRSEELYRLSDSICTGLQLANHWQDVAVDLEKDRVYLPQTDLDRFGVSITALKNRQASPAFRQLLRFQVDRAQALFDEGKFLPERVTGRLRYELRLTAAGGVEILKKIKAVDYDVFRHRPIVTKLDWAKLAVRSALRGQ
jgi:squalene synthase HpnC